MCCSVDRYVIVGMDGRRGGKVCGSFVSQVLDGKTSLCFCRVHMNGIDEMDGER